METSLSAVRRETRRFRLWMGALTALLLVLVVGALGLGRYGISPHDTVALLLEPLGFEAELEGKRRVVENLLFQVRLPRIALAILAGAGLSAAGAAFQALFANPLASPDTLGVATGFRPPLPDLMKLGRGAPFKVVAAHPDAPQCHAHQRLDAHFSTVGASVFFSPDASPMPS